MTVEQAMELLTPAYEGRPSKVLFFNADDDVHYDLAMRVLDAAHGAGVNTIGIMTDPPITQQAPPAEAAPVPQ
jgi:biopolymer transport protein ExbD